MHHYLDLLSSLRNRSSPCPRSHESIVQASDRSLSLPRRFSSSCSIAIGKLENTFADDSHLLPAKFYKCVRHLCKKKNKDINSYKYKSKSKIALDIRFMKIASQDIRDICYNMWNSGRRWIFATNLELISYTKITKPYECMESCLQTLHNARKLISVYQLN